MADSANTPKSSSKAKGQKRATSKKTTPKPKPAETTTEPEVVAAAEAPEPQPEEPKFSAEDWLSASKRQLGIQPWVLRAALSGQPADRKYTRTEINKLVRQALNTPA